MLISSNLALPTSSRLLSINDNILYGARGWLTFLPAVV